MKTALTIGLANHEGGWSNHLSVDDVALILAALRTSPPAVGGQQGIDLDELKTEAILAVAKNMRLGYYALQACDEIARLRTSATYGDGIEAAAKVAETFVHARRVILPTQIAIAIRALAPKAGTP